MVMTVVGERSNPITFKGLPRQDFIDIFGNSTYIQGRQFDFTNDADYNTAKTLPLTMWLYRFQYFVSNPLQERINYNIHLTGERTAPWFPDWQPLEAGETKTDIKLKYSLTRYDNVCVVLDRDIPRFTGSRTSVVCSPLVPYNGPATTIAGAGGAAQGQSQPPAPGAEGGNV